MSTAMNTRRPAVRPGAFTLIELLIVVAIIAILAAIAVPNFLEAQVRSKVSRARADMRTLATAVEAYAVDSNRYPYVPVTFNGTLAERIARLTTPIAYVASIPADPFKRRAGTSYGEGSSEDPTGTSYLYNTGHSLVGPGNPDPASLDRFGWSLTSGGPDGELKFPYWPFARTFIISNQYVNFIYDPTNGTVSQGEIFLRGGRVTEPIPEIDTK
jgi:prepilin-type N-terminal cleavage/methylation domain-containing protein